MSPAVRASAWVLGVWIVAAGLALVLPLDVAGIDLPRILAPPGPQAWLGRDDLGRDILQRLLLGAWTSLWIAVAVTAAAGSAGVLIGTLAALAGRWTDAVLVRVMDVFLAFPGMLLAIALAGVLGPGPGNVVIALSAVGWVGFARLARAQTLSVRGREHVQAARALGTAPLALATRHVLPLIAAPLVVEATFTFAGAVMAEAALSFLGLGVQPPTPSWGSMIRDGVAYMLVAPHVVTAPGLAIAMVVLAVNLLGDALRDAMDVRGERPVPSLG